MTATKEQLDQLFEAGLQYGAHRSKRHPSVRDFIFGSKNNAEIIDLEKTASMLESAEEYMHELGKARKQVLFIGNKNEARKIVREVAQSIKMPWVALRWIGGTFTNNSEIKKRVDRLLDLKQQETSGGFGKYTKRERTLLGKEIEDLERVFGGIVDMDGLPKAVVMVDPGAEELAVAEAKKSNIPMVALASSDCDISMIKKPIVGNDKNVTSIRLVMERLAKAYEAGLKEAPAPAPKKEEKSASK